MLKGILQRLGFCGQKSKSTIQEVKLDIAGEVRKFEHARQRIDCQIGELEQRTDKLDNDVALSLSMTKENQQKLENIETMMGRILELAPAALDNMGANTQQFSNSKKIYPNMTPIHQ